MSLHQNALNSLGRVIDGFERISQIRSFVNPTYGQDLNQNGLGTVALEVFDGTDSALWDWNIITGSAGAFAISTDQNHTPAGTKSLNFTPGKNGDVVDVRNASPIDLTTYTAVQGWVYLTAWADLSKDLDFFGYDSVGDQIVGNEVLLSTYVNINNLNAWQSFNIPLVDLGLVGETLDSFRFRLNGTPPVDGYLDDIALLSDGGFVYTLKPLENEVLAFKTLQYSFGMALDTTLADATMINLDYTKFFGQASLSNGMRFSREQGGDILFSGVWRNVGELLSSPNSTINNAIGNGVNFFTTFEFVYPEPAILLGELGDAISIQVNDDISFLDYFRVSSGCYLRRIRT